MPLFPSLTTEKLLKRLTYPEGRIRMVLDTDTYNEIDDQFAVVYAMKSSERLQVEAFYAAPFHNERSSGPKEGMERSYAELKKIQALLPEMADIPIHRGAERYLPDGETPVESAAARDLVRRAMASSEDDPLYVVGIAAITNIASAILMEPEIIQRIVVIWLGGHALEWPNTKEFNLEQDYWASSILLNSGVPLVLIPCMGLTSHLHTTLPEMAHYVKECGGIGSYLYETFEACSEDHYALSRVIWDIATIGYLIDETWAPSTLVHSPVLSTDFRWSKDTSRPWIRYVHYIDRNLVFRDLFRKLDQG